MTIIDFQLKSFKFAKSLFITSIVCYAAAGHAQNKPVRADTVNKKVVAPVAEQKDESNRNVMLNASNNNGPREVNVGLPSTVGGTTILENDLPVVYTFWPELPNRTWRGSVSLGKSGLLGLKEASITTGDFGYAVNSYTKLGTEKTEFVANLAGSHYGWLKGDVNLSGKLTKNWYYSAGVFQNYDPQSFDLGFTGYSDKTQLYRAGITHRFANKKGEISLLYKYAQSASINNAAVFRYQEGGAVEELDNFRIGRDSYFLRSGNIRMLDGLKGDFYNFNIGNTDDIKMSSHNLDLLGNYQLANNWKLKFIVRYHNARSSAFTAVPTSIKTAVAGDGFYYADSQTPYTGDVQVMFASHSRETPLSTINSRFEMVKKTDLHSWRFGLTEANYNSEPFSYNRTFYYQTVEPQPQQLSNYGAAGSSFATTDQYGFYNYNAGFEYFEGTENKATAYFSDTWKVSQKFDLSYGLNLRSHLMKGNYYAKARTAGFTLQDKVLTPFNHSWFNVGASVNAVYKITKHFGLIGDFIYSENNGTLNDYSSAFTPNMKESKSPFASVGVYLNTPKISLVSAVTYLTKNNFRARLNLTNPANVTQTVPLAVNYDIKTLGWTTDVVAKPFERFNLHYLVTIQDPVYQNYNFEAFDNAYSYNDKSVLQISNILMEIDPSYTLKKTDIRFWASLRYFGKQYANLTNALYFKGWWETFVGADYKMNKTTTVGLSVINPLNQRGAKGTINGAELITDPAPYYNKLLTSSYILPFTVQASLTLRL